MRYVSRYPAAPREPHCKIPGCYKPIEAWGWCCPHYNCWRDHGDPRYIPPPRVIRVCAVPDCRRKHSGLGFCAKHWLRFKKTGDPLGVLPRASGSKTHGMTGTPEYRAWHGMRQRCTNPRTRSWRNYGGRTDPGPITVCPHWLASFEIFYQDMGPRPDGLCIDRIDNDKGYWCAACNGGVSNCRWATRVQSLRNRRGWSGTGYKGVVFIRPKRGKGAKHCRAQITVDGRRRYLGNRRTADNAAVLYDLAALRYFGPDDAVLNFPLADYEAAPLAA